MQELELTWQRTLSIWWLIVWRGLVGSILLGGLVGFIVAFVGGMMHLPTDTMTLASQILGLGVGLVWWSVVVRMALGKQYGKFRIALVAR